MSLPPLQQESWVDVPDVTVTLDPVRDAHWIRDGYNTHAATEARARALDRRDLLELQGALGANSYDPPQMYTPSTAQIDALPYHFAYPAAELGQPCKVGSGGLRDMSRAGKLPALQAQIYAGLPSKSTGQIEAEIREDERRRNARVFSRN